MKLTSYIRDLGHPVAFYPGLNKITGSTTATLLLCQLLYWTDKTQDGWIWKTNYQLTEETGLTYYEQKTARRILRNLGILREEFKRWDRTNRYWINQNKLNELWETACGREVEAKQAEKTTPEYVQTNFDELEKSQPLIQYKEATSGSPRARRTAAKVKGDMVDGLLELAKNTPVEAEEKKNEIRSKIATKLHINIDSSKWDRFINHAYTQQEKHGQPVERFISWILENNPNPTYWTPDKFVMWYPQAFLTLSPSSTEKFVVNEPVPLSEEEGLSEIPDFVRRPKKNLY